MNYPPLVQYASEADYRTHFERVYCRGPITTFDGISVRFRRCQFDHGFFESSQRNRVKDLFSTQRAERIDWIKATLQDPNSDRFVGWDRNSRTYDNTRRVALVQWDYVVVIALTGSVSAQFVTAYVVDTPNSLARIRRSPRWT